MLTIIEGPDGAGKSTLLDSLGKFFAIDEVEHHGPYKGISNPAFKYYESILGADKRHVVLDRSWISEPIYGAAVRGGENRVSAPLRRMLERLTLSFQGVVVYALPSMATCLGNIKGRDKDAYLLKDNGEPYKMVYHLYDQATITPGSLPHVVYDYENLNVSDLAELIDELRPAANQGPGIGSWQPGKSILVVGERANQNNAYDDQPFPFVSIKRGNVGCSTWLTDQFEQAGIPENRLYWVNALDTTGRYTSTKFIDLLEPPEIIALGRAAKTWCERLAQVPCHAYPHPQYWKRFKTRLEYPMLTDLKEGKIA